MNIKKIILNPGSEYKLVLEGKTLLNIVFSVSKFEIRDEDDGRVIIEYNGCEVPFDNTLSIILDKSKITIRGG